MEILVDISVYAYGESRFNLVFNPCNANINSLCPLNSSIPINANGIIPVAPSDVANIPAIALTIPDFEGMAILRIFANSTESQIACFSAVVTNGASFSHPSAVAPVLGTFAVVALISSIATSIYGQNIPEMRKHYAHSVSMLVVFSVYHHIFFTGSLSMNWPSVLVSFWSNYAWSAGIIYTRHMQNSINQFIGGNFGNISVVGAAPNNQNAVGLGGGFQIGQIYKRASLDPLERYSQLLKRQASSAANTTNTTTQQQQFSWYGKPTLPGLPLPGNYSGFAGTLAELDIPASNAFLTGLLWFLIFIACLVGALTLLKWAIEALAACKIIKTTRLGYFRKHWLWYTGAAVLRTCYIAFFMMTFLTMFQFTLGGAHVVKSIAAVMLSLFLVGMLGVSAFAIWYRTKSEILPEPSEEVGQESQSSEKTASSTWFKASFKKVARSQGDVEGATPPRQTWWQKHFPDFGSGRVHPHDDERYSVRFGWLASRFRRSKWWFFSAWLIYELVRAAFYGGAAGHALTQVFGLLAWEILALVGIVLARPFESNRLNLIMVYFLGFSKVATVALASAFDPRFGLDRIMTTVIGIVIIVIQGILTLCLFIAISLAAVSSYMSVTRYQETMKPRSWLKPRSRYFAHIDRKATDLPKPPAPAPPPEPEAPREPYFTVSSVRREPKIEDEDSDVLASELRTTPRPSTSMDAEKEVMQQISVSRSTSMRSRTSMSNLPYGARPHRLSWSTRDFQSMEFEPGPHATRSRMSMESIHDMPNRNRTASLREASRAATPMGDADDPQMMAGLEGPLRRGHRRSASMPLGPRRNNSTVAEEMENDSDSNSPNL